MFLPTKSSACNALEAFLPGAGREYASGRNYDTGPEEEAAVSRLSPWIRIRMLPEWSVVAAVLQQHSQSAASKFIDEVCWRTYWKGWLQLRPTVWDDYLNDLWQLQEDFQTHSAYQKAIAGRTGIKCFDTWNAELLENNYLHNHARMWYASIWIHTLKLPWQLGADWFLRHLLDGDPASNTLSWRWVAGAHTRGKSYLARPSNIRKYTNGRLQVEENLAVEPLALEEAPLAEPKALEPIHRAPEDLRLGLLITEEDLSAANWITKLYHPSATAKYFPSAQYDALRTHQEVLDFRYASLSQIEGDGIFKKRGQLVDWARNAGLEGVVTAEPTIGHWPELLEALRADLAIHRIEVYTTSHWWDQTLFPHATKGFFRFKKAIPNALEQL